jgi:isoleucyl-tRNA synthetase
LYLEEDLYDALSGFGSELKFIFITASAEIERLSAISQMGSESPLESKSPMGSESPIRSESHMEPEAVSEIHATQINITEDPGIQLSIVVSQDKKCERCWHYCPEIGHHLEHPTLCDRCVGNISEDSGAHEVRRYA